MFNLKGPFQNELCGSKQRVACCDFISCALYVAARKKKEENSRQTDSLSRESLHRLVSLRACANPSKSMHVYDCTCRRMHVQVPIQHAGAAAPKKFQTKIPFCHSLPKAKNFTGKRLKLTQKSSRFLFLPRTFFFVAFFSLFLGRLG